MFENEEVRVVNLPKNAKISWLDGQKVLSSESRFVPQHVGEYDCQIVTSN